MTDSPPSVAPVRPCPGCGKPLGRRAKLRHRGCDLDGAPVVTSEDPEPWEYLRIPVYCSFVLMGLGVVLSYLGRDEWPLVWLGVVLLYGMGAFAYYFAERLHDEEVEDAKVWTRICRVTGDKGIPDKRAFVVHARAHRTPVDVTVRPGPNFRTGPEGVHDLAAALADGVGAAPNQVVVDRGKGSYRLRLDDLIEPDWAGEIVHLEKRLPVRDPSEPVTPLVRLQEGLAAALDAPEAVVEVEDWETEEKPRALSIHYPPRIAGKARTKRGDLMEAMRALHLPTGAWFVTWQPGADRFAIVDAPDPLAGMVPLPAVERHPDLLAGVAIGLIEDGTPWLIPLVGGLHTLVAGATGAGKGSVLWGVIRALEEMIRAGEVRIWIIDPKGGVEFDRMEGVAYRFAAEPEDCRDALQEAVGAMNQKFRAMKGNVRKIERPTRELPLDIIVVDELASVVGDAAPAKIKGECNSLMVALLSKGRAALCTVIAAVQDPRKANLGLRAYFQNTLALRLSEADETRQVLGNGVRATGAMADRIPKSMPGTGYVVRDGESGGDEVDAIRVRAAFVSDPEIDRLVASLAR